MSQNQKLNTRHIPILSDLIAPGNPDLKLSEKQKKAFKSQSANLNMRIDDIEVAIGQDASDPIGRAYAIRAEEEFESMEKS